MQESKKRPFRKSTIFKDSRKICADPLFGKNDSQRIAFLMPKFTVFLFFIKSLCRKVPILRGFCVVLCSFLMSDKWRDSPYKYYFSDIGLRNARLNFRQQEQPHILENLIYNELIVRGYNVDVGIVEKNIRDESGKQKSIQYEVDFVCNLGSKRYYIQSAFSIPDSQKMEQERTPLLRINDSFKKFIIVQDHVKTWQDENGFIIMNVLDFLLNPDSLNYN